MGETGGSRAAGASRARKPAPKRAHKPYPVRTALTPERLALMRKLYETTPATLTAIAADLGVTARTLTRYVKSGGWVRAAQPREKADGSGVLCPGLALCPVRAVMHRRLYDSLERRLRLAEAAEPGPTTADRERDTRILATLARTLDRLVDRDQAALAPAALAEEPPYDVEALRRELSDRLHRLIEARRERDAEPTVAGR